MEPSSVTARAALVVLRAGATIMTPILTPAHITSIQALLEAAGGTVEEDETLRVLRTLQAGLAAVQAGLAAVLEGRPEGQPEGQPRAKRTKSASACQTVMGQPHLLLSLMEWLATDARIAGNRRQLSTLALVCRQWKEVGRQDRFWRGLVGGRLRPGSCSGASAFESAAAYGRCLFQTPMYDGRGYIAKGGGCGLGLWLYIEVYDARDGFNYYNGCGPLRKSHEGQNNDYLHFAGPGMMEVDPAPFSGIERGVSKVRPYHRDNDDIRELFTSESGSEDKIHIRVLVSCQKTGKTAVLWKDGYAPDIEEPSNNEDSAGHRCRAISSLSLLQAPGTACFPHNYNVDSLQATLLLLLEPRGGQNPAGYGGHWRAAKTVGNHSLRCPRIQVTHADKRYIIHFILALLNESP